MKILLSDLAQLAGHSSLFSDQIENIDALFNPYDEAISAMIIMADEIASLRASLELNVAQYGQVIHPLSYSQRTAESVCDNTEQSKAEKNTNDKDKKSERVKVNLKTIRHE